MIFYSLNNISKLPQYKLLSDEIKEAINIVGTILPFRVNNYVAENLEKGIAYIFFGSWTTDIFGWKYGLE